LRFVFGKGIHRGPGLGAVVAAAAATIAQRRDIVLVVLAQQQRGKAIDADDVVVHLVELAHAIDGDIVYAVLGHREIDVEGICRGEELFRKVILDGVVNGLHAKIVHDITHRVVDAERLDFVVSAVADVSAIIAALAIRSKEFVVDATRVFVLGVAKLSEGLPAPPRKASMGTRTTGGANYRVRGMSIQHERGGRSTPASIAPDGHGMRMRHGHRVGVQHHRSGTARARAHAHAHLVRDGLGTLVLDLRSNHKTADIRFATDEKLVGIRSDVRAYRDSFEAIDVELPLKTLVASLIKVLLHDGLLEILRIVDLEGTISLPRDDITESAGFALFQHTVQLPGESGLSVAGDLREKSWHGSHFVVV